MLQAIKEPVSSKQIVNLPKILMRKTKLEDKVSNSFIYFIFSIILTITILD